MIDTLVIVVYDRYDNLKKWFDILKQCTIKPKNVVVIHNIDATGTDYGPLCRMNDSLYIQRENIGFDIGAFQDVCMNRLPGFPEWDQLLWCTDDCFPMQKDFLNHFALQKGEGIRCMEISPYVRPHVRTTGFSITRQVAEKLIFPADPITTKQHCYLFEHRWAKHTLLDQVKRMGLSVLMAAPRETSPMFDTGYHRRLKRDAELNKTWNIDITPTAPVMPDNPKVTIICPIYKSFPAIISSLIMQTYKNWELLLIHDGPEEGHIKTFVELVNDDRIKFIETKEHVGNWGHSYRSEYIHKADGEYILITNADNQHVPVYLEYMLKGFGDGVIATYCSEMVHSYKAHQVIPCTLKRGYIDCAGVLVKTSAAKAVGWVNTTEHSADWIYFQDLISKFGVKSFMKVRGCLLIHN
jgi:hypothetical protein